MDFTGPEFTDSTLEVLKAVPFLRRPDLQGARVTNQGLVSLRGSTNLLSLDLQDTDVSDDGLQELKPLVNLRSLVLALHLRRRRRAGAPQSIPSLRSLNLSRLKITDRGMQSIRGLTQRVDTAVPNCYGRWAGVPHRVDRPSLGSLQDTQATDAAPKHLKALTRLRRLNIRGTKASDAGLRHLAVSVELKSLDIGNTRVSDAGLRTSTVWPICDA